MSIFSWLKKKTRSDREFKSVEEAGNFLKEKDKTVAQDIKKEMAGAPISVTDPASRSRYLLYCISFLQDRRLKALLSLRINGASTKQLAHFFKVPEKTVLHLESEALKRAKDAIALKQKTAVPIVGG